MAGILNRKNSEFKGLEAIAPTRAEEALNAEKSALELYKGYLETKEAFQVRFDACDKKGTFTSLVAGNLILSLSAEDLRKSMINFRPFDGGFLIGFPFDVRVKSIDEDASIVYLESSRKTPKEKSQIIRELRINIDRDKTPLVWGRVYSSGIKGQYANVNIFDAGILGIINVRNWQKTYLRDLSEVCKEGIPYQFEVTGIRKSRDNRPEAYFLSHVNIEDYNPWDNLVLNGVTEGGTLIVKCEELPVGKSFWWGRSDRLAGIEIQGDFVNSAKSKSALTIYKDIHYRCKIKKIVINPDGDVSKNRLRVYPYGVSDEDAELYAKTKVLIAREAQENKI